MFKKALLGLGVTCVCLMVSTASTQAATKEVVLYTSDATTVSGTWAKTSDIGAASTQLWSSPDAGVTTSNPNKPKNYVEFQFNADAQTAYRVWVRLRAQKDSIDNDSVYVQFSDSLTVSGASAYRIGSNNALTMTLQNCTSCRPAGWGWTDTTFGTTQSSIVTFATTGAHTIRVQAREDGVQFDQIVISASSYFSMAPGLPTNDRTIVAKASTAPAAPTPYSGTAIALPGTIRIEQFDNGGEGIAYHDTTAGNAGGAFRSTGVDLEPAIEGGYNVGWTTAGEWLLYSVNVATAGNYTLEARVASEGQGGLFHVEVGGVNVTGALTIPNTGNWQVFQTISKTVTLTAGAQFAKVVFDTPGPTTLVGNMAWLKFTSTPAAQPPTRAPYLGTAVNLPGTIQATNYDKGGEGIGYHDTTPGNSGGAYRTDNVDIEASTLGAYNIGWTTAGEWLSYSVNVQTAGTYNLALRVASPYSTGKLTITAGANTSAATTVENTGDWQIWRTMTVPMTLAAGAQVLTITVNAGDFNIADLTATLMTTPQPAVATPYTGTAIALPGTFSAVQFDNGGEGVAYHDTTAGNSGNAFRATDVDMEASTIGGYNIGWTVAGEWLAYSVNVAAAGNYTVTLATATPVSTGKVRVSVGSATTASTAVPSSSDWQIWSSITMPITLAAGPQTLKLFIDGNDVNVGNITVAPVPATLAPPTTPTTPATPPASATPTAPATTSTPAPGTGGITRVVNAGGDLQAALNAAQPGDTIMLAAGATFVGNFVLPVKSGSTYINVRSSAPDASLPDANTRITPAYASLLPKLQSPNSSPALATAAGAHHWRIQAIEFLPTYQGFYDVVALGDGGWAQSNLSQVPHDIVIDRVYIHGDVVFGQKRAIGLNSANTWIVNSYIAEIKAPGQDSQGIGGWNGPGPFTISNNYIEAAGENVMFGGSDPAIPQLVPSDITITRNHITKQLAWRGQNFVVKNLLELKSAQRVVIDGNIIENNWQAGQSGYAILFTVRNQDGGAPWSVVQNIRFTNNIVQHVASGVNILATDYLQASQTSRDIVIRNNVFDDVNGAAFGGSGRFLLINGGSDIVVDHNTVRQDGYTAVYADTNPVTAFTLTNNIIPDYSWAVMGPGTAPGNQTFRTFFPNGTYLSNVFAGSNAAVYPGGNYYPSGLNAVGFMNFAAGDLRLSTASSYKNAGIDGKDVGADIVAIGAATAGVKQQ